MSAYATEQGLTISSVEDVKANAELMTMINNASITLCIAPDIDAILKLRRPKYNEQL